MVIVQLGNGVRYIPALGSDPESFTTQRPFEEWWTHVLVRSREGEEWDRGTRFVLGLAHKEGGAHVDPSPPAWWRAIRDGEWAGAGTTVAPDGRTIPIDSLVLAVVRQVGYEVEMTLQQQLPALLGGIPEIDRAQPPTNTGSIAFASFETPAPPRSPDE
jgi:hypothetical protein